MRSRVVAAAAASLLAVLPTAGCYQGAEGTVNSQGPSGNGQHFSVPPEEGTVQVQAATLVADAADPARASLVMTLVNDGASADALVGVTVGSGVSGATGTPIAVGPGEAVAVGSPGAPAVTVAGVTAPEGSYETVRLTFRDAGSAEAQLLVVPAVGYYEDYAPAPVATPEDAEATPADSE